MTAAVHLNMEWSIKLNIKTSKILSFPEMLLNSTNSIVCIFKQQIAQFSEVNISAFR